MIDETEKRFSDLTRQIQSIEANLTWRAQSGRVPESAQTVGPLPWMATVWFSSECCRPR